MCRPHAVRYICTVCGVEHDRETEYVNGRAQFTPCVSWVVNDLCTGITRAIIRTVPEGLCPLHERLAKRRRDEDDERRKKESKRKDNKRVSKKERYEKYSEASSSKKGESSKS